MRLFDRMGKRVILTAQGQCFLEYANSILDTIHNARRALSEDAELEGCLHIGTLESLCFFRLPGLMHQAGQTEKAEGFQCADVQAALQLGVLAQGAAGVVDGVQNAVGIFQKALALCGQDHPLAHAVEQAHAQLFFA